MSRKSRPCPKLNNSERRLRNHRRSQPVRRRTPTLDGSGRRSAMTRWRVGVGFFLLLTLGLPTLAPYARLAEQTGAWHVWHEAGRLEALAANTAKLVLGTLLIVIPAGIAGAVLFYRTDLPLRR